MTGLPSRGGGYVSSAEAEKQSHRVRDLQHPPHSLLENSLIRTYVRFDGEYKGRSSTIPGSGPETAVRGRLSRWRYR